MFFLDNILFAVDEEQPYYLHSNTGETLSGIIGFPPDVTSVWSSASKIAPFDNDVSIYLS